MKRYVEKYENTDKWIMEQRITNLEVFVLFIKGGATIRQ